MSSSTSVLSRRFGIRAPAALGCPPPDTPYLFAKLLKNWFRSPPRPEAHHVYVAPLLSRHTHLSPSQPPRQVGGEPQRPWGLTTTATAPCREAFLATQPTNASLTLACSSASFMRRSMAEGGDAVSQHRQDTCHGFLTPRYIHMAAESPEGGAVRLPQSVPLDIHQDGYLQLPVFQIPLRAPLPPRDQPPLKYRDEHLKLEVVV